MHESNSILNKINGIFVTVNVQFLGTSGSVLKRLVTFYYPAFFLSTKNPVSISNREQPLKSLPFTIGFSAKTETAFVSIT